MNKRTKQILAIVSIILSVAIVVGIVLFVLASCGNGGTTTTKKKKKKVVIVKKPTTTQTDETSSEEDTDENVYDTDTDNEYKEDETPVVDEEPADEPTKEPEEEVVKPVYEVDLEKVIYNPLNERIGMAIYHMEEGQWDALLGNKYAKEEEFISYYRASNIEQLRNIKKKNGLAWYFISNPFPDRNTNTFKEGWAENIQSAVAAYKAAGLWDVIAGFETEELCMKVTQAQFRTLTRWLRDNFPEKRIFACVSVYEIKDNAPSGFTIAPMTYDTYGYITDIGFDWYSHLDQDRYQEMIDSMLNNMGRRNNVRIWFFPTTHNRNAGLWDSQGKYGNLTNEEFCIEHLNMMYKFLMKQKNPGGLYLYTWNTYGDQGLGELLDPDRQFKWDNLAKRIVEIGKEIRASGYRYDYSLYN